MRIIFCDNCGKKMGNNDFRELRFREGNIVFDLKIIGLANDYCFDCIVKAMKEAVELRELYRESNERSCRIKRMEMRILRVFPRRTSQTPDDENVRIGQPTMVDEADKIMLSVTFSWDIPLAEKLFREWQRLAPVEIGGPAFQRGNNFEPGKFLKLGNTITSRGCPNKCWFCLVWKRDGEIREFQINEGNIIQDDNLLACSDEHIKKVFAMLQNQHAVEFRSLEARRFKKWHVEEMLKLRIKQLFFAYDTPDDLEPLINAGKLLQNAGFNKNKLRCYVLIGYNSDTFEKAQKRLKETWIAGFLPFAMLYSGSKYNNNKEWRKFQRLYTRPAITKNIFKNGNKIYK